MSDEVRPPVLRLTQLRRAYHTRAGELEVLKGVDLVVNPGEIVALIGPSGSGKSSLLHAAGLLEAVQGGTVELTGQDATSLPDAARTALRRQALGFVYQFHHLLPEFSALDNVALPQWIGGVATEAARARAGALLSSMGLQDRQHHQPGQLSGGEQQRVAIARALANKPALLIADEPTGNLDPATSSFVFDIFRKATRDEGSAALVATHNLDLARQMDRVFRIESGRLVED
ncbi:lipoprotein-releasing system ATP-binding protein LolD [Candidatus Phycosocius bacilliformis]|uniref:Lipoprotein-releasing system ATP-binding protein LolD n=1 Tax=Candidatus Phycosocius bacilliformis TaxID=1445552 RepID=A0A2P2EBK5_9PROT|nr:ABC transporter ATP-binding protein [Candidatus Phycosocius bacilliformis]GBF58424.1 lipoprotein-releasing system ATP-binding protein LolD [Candidatus Phycosocius bacilliformis]